MVWPIMHLVLLMYARGLSMRDIEAAFTGAFHTRSGEPRARIGVKALRAAHGDLFDLIDAEKERAAALVRLKHGYHPVNRAVKAAVAADKAGNFPGRDERPSIGEVEVKAGRQSVAFQQLDGF